MAALRRIAVLPLVTCLMAALTGCASPGIPRPPSLHLPATVLDFTATRIGDRVEFHWTAPAQTTDGLDLTTPTTVEICRNPAPNPTECTPVLSLTGHPGPSTATDTLPPSLLMESAPRPLLAYRIRVLNSSGRSAPPSPIALVPAGPSVAAVDSFQAVQRSDGVLLEWRQSPGQIGTVDVLRIAQPSPGSKLPKTPETHLRPEPLSSRTQGLEGMIDQGALQNATYTYQAQRVLTVRQSGKTIDLRGEPTPPVTVSLRDTFPPVPPRGLVAIPGPPIDLSWEPNAESDLAGYLVYRTLLGPDGGRSVRLTDGPLPGPAYRDAATVPGDRYEYRVTAVDRDGNESPPSLPVQASPNGP